MTIEVLNLATGDTRTYVGITPERAVVCAYAQGTRDDWNTWQYDKYAALVEHDGATVICGDWSARRDGRRLTPGTLTN